MNNRNRRNLVRLAEYLIKLSDASFNMYTYLDHEGSTVDFGEFNLNEHECGSVGCCIGHSLLIDDMEYKELEYLIVTWGEQADNLFGFDEADTTYGEYLFSPSWGSKDNTPIGAAKRIIAVLTYSDRRDYLSLDVSMLPSIESYKD